MIKFLSAIFKFFAFCAILTGIVMGSIMRPAIAQDITFFTIGTGGTAYTYFPVGGMIANAISKPPGSRECGEGGSCGVEGLIVSAVSSEGSADNIRAVISQDRNSGFVQSDLAFWAYSGTGAMAGEEPAKDLRLIATLFDEHVHLVTLAESEIETVGDLEGKRVALGVPGTSTYVDASLILEANDMSIRSVKAVPLAGFEATEALRKQEIDALFLVASYPSALIKDLVLRAQIKLISLDKDSTSRLIEEHQYFSESRIPGGTYSGTSTVSTISVGAQWITSAKEEEKLIYEITKALWNKESRRLLDVGHEKGRKITIGTALRNAGVPLHPGAEKFYREAGIM